MSPWRSITATTAVATARGQAAYATAFEAARSVGRRWAKLVGEDRYAVFVQVLSDIVADGKLDTPHPRESPIPPS